MPPPLLAPFKGVTGAPIWAHLGPKFIIFWVTMDFVIQHWNKLCQHFPGVQNFNTDLLGEMDLKKYGKIPKVHFSGKKKQP